MADAVALGAVARAAACDCPGGWGRPGLGDVGVGAAEEERRLLAPPRPE
jgi:hypothetical protein